MVAGPGLVLAGEYVRCSAGPVVPLLRHGTAAVASVYSPSCMARLPLKNVNCVAVNVTVSSGNGAGTHSHWRLVSLYTPSIFGEVLVEVSF